MRCSTGSRTGSWAGTDGRYVLFTLVATHITIAAVTIFLHRAQAHRALELHAIPSHFFRFWLWLTTGMVTKEWVAIHRKHHAKCETEDDPHSPQTRGIKTVLLTGSELYRTKAKNQETLASSATARRTTGSSATSTRRSAGRVSA
jgi:fatty-acid desaturase